MPGAGTARARSAPASRDVCVTALSLCRAFGALSASTAPSIVRHRSSRVKRRPPSRRPAPHRPHRARVPSRCRDAFRVGPAPPHDVAIANIAPPPPAPTPPPLDVLRRLADAPSERVRQTSGTARVMDPDLPDPPPAPRRRRVLGGKLAPLWRRSGSAHSASSRVSKPDGAPAFADRSCSAPPAAAAGAAFRMNSHARIAALTRMRKAFFDRPDTRVAEDLRSTKRRIIQISRQNDTCPVQCTLGFRSRTGWEPIRAVRENQDCIVALLPWGPQGRFSLFGALDGHGRAGHLCCMFIAQRIITYLQRALSKSKVDVPTALHRSFEYAEQRLEKVTATMDCTVSGSTGVFVLLDDAMLYCANVGDSRAVLGRERPNAQRSGYKRAFAHNINTSSPAPVAPDVLPNDDYIAVPLSFDQKPIRDDEKQRVVAAGGRVDAWKGCDVGAERVWLPDSRTPGLAVTRSFGDFILKDFGVSATPEIYSLPLSRSDRFIVLASDGVFEFVTNEEVVEISGRHRDNGTPQSAAEEIVKLSADRWIDDDSVIDDISCVVVFIDVKFPVTDGHCEPQLVDVDVQNMSNINTPVSSRMNSFRPTNSNSKLLFGQYSHNATISRTVSANSRAPVILPRPEVGIVGSDIQPTSVPLNDVGRRYIEKLKFESTKRPSNESTGTAPTERRRNRKVESRAEPGSEVFGHPPLCSSVTPTSVDMEIRVPGAAVGNASGAAGDVEMYESATGFEGDVSDSSERFEDAEEEFTEMDITAAADERAVASLGAPPLSPTSAAAAAAAVASLGPEGALSAAVGVISPEDALSPVKISPSDDEDEEKYADADTLVPIDNHHKVVRRREVSAHRRRLLAPATPMPRRSLDTVRKKRSALQSAAASMDHHLATLSAARATDAPSSPHPNVSRTPTDGRFRLGRSIRNRRTPRDAYDGTEPAGSGRLRRLLAKQRPRSSISTDGF